MSSHVASMPFPARLRTELKLDHAMLALVVALLLGGFVILASASISISDNATDNPFFYLQRQLVAAVIGAIGAGICLFIPMQVWRNLSPLMLLLGIALLVVVLLPGIGYEVNGARRWVRVGFMNLQASEPARLCILLYLAGYLVRRSKQLREGFMGFLRPMLVLTLACALLLGEPDFGAAGTVAAGAVDPRRHLPQPRKRRRSQARLTGFPTKE